MTGGSVPESRAGMATPVAKKAFIQAFRHAQAGFYCHAKKTLCYNAAIMKSGMSFANNNNNDNDDRTYRWAKPC